MTQHLLWLSAQNCHYSDNTLANAGIAVEVEYISNNYVITSKKYGSNISVILNSIDASLEEYLSLNSGSSSTGTGGTVGASLTNN